MFGLVSSSLNPKYDDNKKSFIGIVYERKSNYFLFSCEGNNYYIYQKNHQYEVFDILYIEGNQNNLSFETLEGEFDFNKYLFNKKVEREIKVDFIHFKWKNIIRKSSIINRILSNYDDNSAIILGKLLFNKNDDDLTNTLYDLNISSYFSLSGIHIYFLYSFFNKLILFLTNKKKTSKYISLGLIFPFLYFANYKISLIKNWLYISTQDNKNINNNYVLMILLLLIILINYRFLYTISFVFLFVLPFIMKLLSNGINSYNSKNKKIVKIIMFNLIISIINLFYNGSYYIINLILSPVIMIIMQIYVIVVVISFILPIQEIINIFSGLLINLVMQMDKMPIIYVSENNVFLVVILGLIVFLMTYLAELRLLKKVNIVLCLYFVSLSLFCIPLDAYFSQYVVFINVGQGDCALIHNKSIDILIDVGGSMYKDIGNKILIPFLKKKHISDIDCIFISHNDYDHSGSLDSLKNSFKVEEVIIGSNFYNKQIGNINFINLNKYYIGEEDNDNSSVIFFEFIGYKFLFMGDATSKVEQKILEDNPLLKADIIKIGHHGSETSSSYLFLQTINPKEAIISVGKNNYYGHPSEIVLKYLIDLNINIRRTDLEGSIYYLSCNFT